jgi:hypothetical protein
LLIATAIGMLIIGLMRIVLKIKFGVVDFAAVTFLLSFLNIPVYFFIQFGSFIFPYLANYKDNLNYAFYSGSIFLIGLFLLFLFPFLNIFKIFIDYYFVNYSHSWKYFPFLVPIIYFESIFQAIQYNMIKAFRRENLISYIQAISLLAVIFILCVGVYFNNIYVVVTSSVFGGFIRFIFLQKVLKKYFFKKLAFFDIEQVLIVLLYMILYYETSIVTSILISCSLLFIYIYFRRRKIVSVFHLVRSAA